MKSLLLLSLLVLYVSVATASHINGGYIQAKARSGLTYDISVFLYLNELVPSAVEGLNSVTICFGDGQTGTVIRSTRVFTNTKELSLNTYPIAHTYAGPGTYTITVSIPGRTNALNLSNILNPTFTLATTFITGTGLSNQTPTASATPLIMPYAGLGQPVTLSLQATDAEGDSIVYGLTRPQTSTNENTCGHQLVTGYQFPNDFLHQGTFTLHNQTGQLNWIAPAQAGSYSVALNLYEYRKGVLISQTLQEFTLLVEDLPGTPVPIPPYEPAIEGAVVTAITDYADKDVDLITFPNPVEGRLQVVIQSSNPTTALLQLVDEQGRSLHELRFPRAARQHEQVIGMDSLSPGIYFLKADVNGRQLLRKVVKK